LFTQPELTYLTEAVGYNSDLQAQTNYLVRGLINDYKIKKCKDFEEEEGRINSDMLKRLIIVGAPLIQAGPGMQDQLVKQVACLQYFPLSSILLP
jgi:hypothetical protein